MKTDSDKPEGCPICQGKQWMITIPHYLPTPCPECAIYKSVAQIEKERGVFLVKPRNGIWMETLLQ